VELEDLRFGSCSTFVKTTCNALAGLDRMNCYLWGGREWGASICRDYYNMHFRPDKF